MAPSARYARPPSPQRASVSPSDVVTIEIPFHPNPLVFTVFSRAPFLQWRAAMDMRLKSCGLTKMDLDCAVEVVRAAFEPANKSVQESRYFLRVAFVAVLVSAVLFAVIAPSAGYAAAGALLAFTTVLVGIVACLRMQHTLDYRRKLGQGFVRAAEDLINMSKDYSELGVSFSLGEMEVERRRLPFGDSSIHRIPTLIVKFGLGDSSTPDVISLAYAESDSAEAHPNARNRPGTAAVEVSLSLPA